MRFDYYRTSVATVALGMIGATTALAGPPQAAVDKVAPLDLGALGDHIGAQTISVTIALKLRDPAGAEALMRRLGTAGDPLFQQFQTPAQVRAQFGPAQADVDSVIAQLSLAGLTVERSSATTLKATGTVATMEQVFQTSLHQFEVAATRTAPGYHFQAALSRPIVPARIALAVQAVLGLNTQPVFHSNYRQSPSEFAGAVIESKKGSPTPTGNLPGFLTVTDFANRYDVDPLYARGVDGSGRTMGIVTFAAMTPSDAFAYWNSLNLKTDPNRLSIVEIDGGPGAPIDASDSGETTLDVEQSGGLAPGAHIIVYQAPNTNQGLVDAFAASIEDNRAESISTSWGQWEFFDNLANAPVSDAFTGETVSTLRATHELLLLAALQGQSLFAATGDSGAYDLVGQVGPGLSTPLSVDYPSSDPAITAVGGTTLPGTQTFATSSGTLAINLPTERVWGWDYLEPLCNAAGLTPMACGIYPSGGGGGVSVFFPMPFYQFGLPGTQRSQAGQALIDETTTPPTAIFDLPGNFAGRNLPDVSFNADSQTGYTVFYTSDSNGFGVQSFGGGTSFVAPQMNGVTALLGQDARHRLGLLNLPLYALAHTESATRGPQPVFNTIAAGDNWFYSGRNGYSPAVGLGTLNVANLATWLR